MNKKWIFLFFNYFYATVCFFFYICYLLLQFLFNILVLTSNWTALRKILIAKEIFVFSFYLFVMKRWQPLKAYHILKVFSLHLNFLNFFSVIFCTVYSWFELIQIVLRNTICLNYLISGYLTKLIYIFNFNRSSVYFF